MTIDWVNPHGASDGPVDHWFSTGHVVKGIGSGQTGTITAGDPPDGSHPGPKHEASEPRKIVNQH